MKFFLLIANDTYYPEVGTQDWLGTFATEAEAQAEITKLGDKFDRYEIIDLRKWINR